MRAVIAALALAAAAAMAAEPMLPKVDLTYAVSWGGMSLGDTKVTLEPTDAADCYRYQSVTDPVGMVRMFYGAPTERSEFCIVNGRLQSRRFDFINPADTGDNFTLEFDWAARRLRSSRGEDRELTDNTVDRFAIQQAVRLWVVEHQNEAEPGTVEFTMVDDERTKFYRFAITRRETVRVPAGNFEAVLVERIDDPNKSSKFWLAPSLQYMPVKVEQTRANRPQLKMALKKS